MVEGDVLALASGKLGNDFGDFGGERELAALDGAKHEHIGDGLRGREKTEDGFLGDRLPGFRIDEADGFMEGHDAVPSDQNHAAVIAAALDVVFDDGFEMPQP